MVMGVPKKQSTVLLASPGDRMSQFTSTELKTGSGYRSMVYDRHCRLTNSTLQELDTTVNYRYCGFVT